MRWIPPPPVRVPAELQAFVGGHPLVAQTLVRRGIATADAARAFLDPAAYAPAPPEALPQLARAVGRVACALERGEPICVWGDFDVDGQTSTALLVETLRELGGRVSHHIPIRETESHGITLPALEAVLDGGVRLLLTCDTGSSEREPIRRARARGVDVVVTDHHALPDDLPAAHALVNPQALDASHPLRHLPGVGVAFKLSEALYARAGRPEAVCRHLDLVALGIVADLAVQRGDTRHLLQLGLARLRRTPRVGLQLLMEAADVEADWLSEEHVAFALAPRLNALGRLADANPAVELLTTDDAAAARLIVTQLEGLNARRKLLCDQVFAAALEQIKSDRALLAAPALVLDHPSWPPGVIGIVASRLVEHFHRPTVLIASPPGERARGSARSIEGCHITEAIGAQRGLLHGYGGHPMAAGLALDAVNIPAFRRAFLRTIEQRHRLPREADLQIDGTLPLEAISLELVADLERLAPFGPGNPPLTLASTRLTLSNARELGRNREHRRVNIADDAGCARPVIWWRGGEWPLPRGRIDLAYRLRASTFQGRRDVQIEWVDARPLEEPPAAGAPRATVAVRDERRAKDPAARLRALQAEGEVQVWREAADVPGRTRLELERTHTLAIWTLPPAPGVVRDALRRARPHTVAVFGVDPGMDEARAFLARLAGLLKFALGRREGRAELAELAAATAHAGATVRAGLDWLAAQGAFHIEVEGDAVRVAAGPGGPRAAPAEVATEVGVRLQAQLAEAAAYRAHFLSAEAQSLFAFSAEEG